MDIGITSYRGPLDQPTWTDNERGACSKRLVISGPNVVTDQFSTLCTVRADTTKFAKSRSLYYALEIKFMFGLTELAAQVSWMENVSSIFVLSIFRLLMSHAHLCLAERYVSKIQARCRGFLVRKALATQHAHFRLAERYVPKVQARCRGVIARRHVSGLRKQVIDLTPWAICLQATAHMVLIPEAQAMASSP
jgi:IQ calmodulin-binding motif